MNYDLWTKFSENLPCPNCEIGKLEFDQHDIRRETFASLKDNEFHKNGTVFPYTVEFASTIIKCKQCKEIVLFNYKIIEDVRHTDDNGAEISIIEPLMYYPAPKIINIPKSCNNEVRELLLQSFLLFWIDKSSCGNKIRISVEALMNHFKIATTDKKGNLLMLDSRIEMFKKYDSKVSGYLKSVKWIGNAASHLKELTAEAVLDAYKILEYSLELLFNDKQKEIDSMSTKINIAKGHV